MINVLGRWLRFNLAGLLGVGVQLLVLSLLARHWHYLLATIIAVESAVLHNFAWHEQMTWRTRIRAEPRGVWMRLFRFHIANGLVSLAGNSTLMYLFVQLVGMRILPANVLAIVTCGLVNFALAEWFVFTVKVPPRALEDREHLFI